MGMLALLPCSIALSVPGPDDVTVASCRQVEILIIGGSFCTSLLPAGSTPQN